MEIITGKVKSPPRVLLYSPEGVGKTEWASKFKKVVFVGAEDGMSHLDTPRFPEAENFRTIMGYLKQLREEEHDFKAVALDTLDWIEPLIHRHICDVGGKKNIDAFGFGKGFARAVDRGWRPLLRALNQLRIEKRMAILLLAHSDIKTFNNPEGENYDRYTLKLHKAAGAVVKEWCDTVLFANHEIKVSDEDDSDGKPRSTGRRVIYSTRTPAYDAKNRYSFPAVLPLDADAFMKAFNKFFEGSKEATKEQLKKQEEREEERVQKARDEHIDEEDKPKKSKKREPLDEEEDDPTPEEVEADEEDKAKDPEEEKPAKDAGDELGEEEEEEDDYAEKEEKPAPKKKAKKKEPEEIDEPKPKKAKKAPEPKAKVEDDEEDTSDEAVFVMHGAMKGKKLASAPTVATLETYLDHYRSQMSQEHLAGVMAAIEKKKGK